MASFVDETEADPAAAVVTLEDGHFQNVARGIGDRFPVFDRGDLDAVIGNELVG